MAFGTHCAVAFKAEEKVLTRVGRCSDKLVNEQEERRSLMEAEQERERY